MGAEGLPLVVNLPNKPNHPPHFFGEMSYAVLRTLREQRGHSNRDGQSLLITPLFTLEQIERKRGPGDPELRLQRQRNGP